jgi:hypothetical protein
MIGALKFLLEQCFQAGMEFHCYDEWNEHCCVWLNRVSIKNCSHRAYAATLFCTICPDFLAKQ